MKSLFSKEAQGFKFAVPEYYGIAIDQNRELSTIELNSINSLNTFELIIPFESIIIKNSSKNSILNISNFLIFDLVWSKIKYFHKIGQQEKINEFLNFHCINTNLKEFIFRLELAINYFFDNGFQNQEINLLEIKFILENWINEKKPLLSIPFKHIDEKIEYNNFLNLTNFKNLIREFESTIWLLGEFKNPTILEKLNSNLVRDIRNKQIYFDCNIPFSNDIEFIENFSKYIESTQNDLKIKLFGQKIPSLESGGFEYDGKFLDCVIEARNIEISEYDSGTEPAKEQKKPKKPNPRTEEAISYKLAMVSYYINNRLNIDLKDGHKTHNYVYANLRKEFKNKSTNKQYTKSYLLRIFKEHKDLLIKANFATDFNLK